MKRRIHNRNTFQMRLHKLQFDACPIYNTIPACSIIQSLSFLCDGLENRMGIRRTFSLLLTPQMRTFNTN
ncbi:CLUMA_CG020804, isoform A [Clunio marinus]|uniref:CLUMA_CG020804, isoform A n=1 Tax=Clunio marinus TaxID=568069 RepID=A0A1J1J790_9DIPT|nr:CLUMA_CG020804, isoform A [Clunio marinus]